jgi:hypothetical protein
MPPRGGQNCAGIEVARTAIDAQGRFDVRLPAGSYEIVPRAVAGLMGTASAVGVQLDAGDAPEAITLVYDTGSASRPETSLAGARASPDRREPSVPHHPPSGPG